MNSNPLEINNGSSKFGGGNRFKGSKSNVYGDGVNSNVYIDDRK